MPTDNVNNPPYHCETLRSELVKAEPFASWAKRPNHAVEIYPATNSSVIVLISLDGIPLFGREVPVTPAHEFFGESELFQGTILSSLTWQVRQLVNETI